MTLRHITIQKTGCQNTLSLDVRTSNLAKRNPTRGFSAVNARYSKGLKTNLNN